ncbi:hypothetical protein CF335_g5361 [Tilletia laevis]|nr:hypothetical protein CF335_g5361 [Tilletia laevis]
MVMLNVPALGGKSGPLLASTVHPQVRDILNDDSLMGASLGEAMIQAIDMQMKLHTEQDLRFLETLDAKDEDIVLPVTQPGSQDGQDDVLPSTSEGHEPPTLFAHATARVAIELGKASETEAQEIASRVPLVASSSFKDAIFNFAPLPYAVLSQALRFSSMAKTPRGSKQASESGGASQGADAVDEWIIRNEKYMRARLVLDNPRDDGSPAAPTGDETNPSLLRLGIDKSGSHWKEFMVGLGRDSKRVFVNSNPQDSSSSTIRIQRPDKADLPGLLLLDHYRKEVIEINALSAFQSRFETMIFAALKGLDWSNVLVAGGIALAALTSVTDEEAQKSEGSDIDLYLWGLTADQANAKLLEIEKVFASNLPLDEGTGKPIKYAALRNLQTITFVPERYPYRRVQVILKLCLNPMAILLNFDLDQVAVGYTGDEVWMLPRASRALVTGYTTFTMDLIHGSFLESRKATQCKRVFKYGERGYGLRFLPSYIEALPTVPLNQKTTTEKNVPEELLPRDELNVTLREERARVAWWLASHNRKFRLPFRDRRVSMAESRKLNTGEIADSGSLSGWQLFARHIASWELAQLGYFVLFGQEETLVSDFYPDDPLAYDDGPEFSWNEGFSLETLRNAVDAANNFDEDMLQGSLRELGIIPSRYEDFRPRKDFEKLVQVNAEKYLNERVPLKRVILASSLHEALAEPLVAIVHLPKNFRAHAESLLKGASSSFEDVIKANAPLPLPVAHQLDAGGDAGVSSDADSILSYWINGPDPKAHRIMREGTEGDVPIVPHWQLVSRETDEVYEVVHAFRRAHRNLVVEAEMRNRSVRRQVGRRLVRPTERSERDAFERWACTRVLFEHHGDASRRILAVPRWVVFCRFILTQADAHHLSDERYQVDWSEESNDGEGGDGVGSSGRSAAGSKKSEPPQTVEDWVATTFGTSRRFVLRSYDWPDWFRQCLPPVHLLPALENGCDAIPSEFGDDWWTTDPEDTDPEDTDAED